MKINMAKIYEYIQRNIRLSIKHIYLFVCLFDMLFDAECKF